MARQTSETAPRRSTLFGLLALAALVLLFGVPASSLHESGLSASEAAHAWAAVGRLGHDQGRDASLVGDGAVHRLLRGWASWLGTTERALRLPFVISLILAALLTGEVAARLFGPGSRPLVWLLFAASPFLNRPDPLHPGLLAALPMALISGSLVFRRAGASPWWWLAPAVGATALPFVGREAVLVAAAVVIFLACTLRRSPRKTLAVILAIGLAAAMAWWFSRRPLAWPSAARDPGWSAVLPPFALLAAGGLARLPRAATAGACLLALALAVLPFAPWRALIERESARHPAWEADLDRARELTRSGGRLILTGPDRFGMLYTASQGHNPAVPLVLVPEEVTLEDLGDTLRDQLQAWAGQESGLPPILIHPAPATAPPGCTILPDPASRLAILQLN